MATPIHDMGDYDAATLARERTRLLRQAEREANMDARRFLALRDRKEWVNDALLQAKRMGVLVPGYKAILLALIYGGDV